MKIAGFIPLLCFMIRAYLTMPYGDLNVPSPVPQAEPSAIQLSFSHPPQAVVIQHVKSRKVPSRTQNAVTFSCSSIPFVTQRAFASRASNDAAIRAVVRVSSSARVHSCSPCCNAFLECNTRETRCGVPGDGGVEAPDMVYKKQLASGLQDAVY